MLLTGHSPDALMSTNTALSAGLRDGSLSSPRMASRNIPNLQGRDYNRSVGHKLHHSPRATPPFYSRRANRTVPTDHYFCDHFSQSGARWEERYDGNLLKRTHATCLMDC